MNGIRRAGLNGNASDLAQKEPHRDRLLTGQLAIREKEANRMQNLLDALWYEAAFQMIANNSSESSYTREECMEMLKEVRIACSQGRLDSPSQSALIPITGNGRLGELARVRAEPLDLANIEARARKWVRDHKLNWRVETDRLGYISIFCLPADLFWNNHGDTWLAYKLADVGRVPSKAILVREAIKTDVSSSVIDPIEVVSLIMDRTLEYAESFLTTPFWRELLSRSQRS
jgi:hypothetical protein